MSEVIPKVNDRLPKVSATRPGKKRGRKAKELDIPGIRQKKFMREKADGTPYEYLGNFEIYYPGIDAKTGKWKMIFESTGSKLKTDAVDLLQKRVGAVKLNKITHHSAKKDPILRDYIDEVYLKNAEVLAEKGIVEKKRVLNQIKELLGHIKLNKLTAEDVENYLDIKRQRAEDKLALQIQTRKADPTIKKLKRGEDRPALAQATINIHIATIKRIVNFAFEKGQAGDFVTAQVKRIKKPDPKNSKITCLPEDEIPVLLEECGKHSTHLRQFVEFALATGIRIGRIYRLEWSMVQLKNKVIDIPDSKNGDAFRAKLHETALKVLEEREAVKHETSPYVFYDPNTGGRWVDLSEGFEKCVARCGIKNFTFHDLRHTFISHLIRGGAELAMVQQLAGHKTISMTLKYTFLDDATLGTALNKLPSFKRKNSESVVEV